jgi:hypothetical protein
VVVVVVRRRRRVLWDVAARSTTSGRGGQALPLRVWLPCPAVLHSLVYQEALSRAAEAYYRTA